MKIFLIVILAGIIMIPSLAMAGTLQEAFKDVSKQSGFITGDQTIDPIENVVGEVINSFLALIGVVILAIIIYGGGLWLTASGNDEKVGKAKKVITGGIIGLVIVFSAYILVNLTLSLLEAASKGEEVKLSNQ